MGAWESPHVLCQVFNMHMSHFLFALKLIFHQTTCSHLVTARAKKHAQSKPNANITQRDHILLACVEAHVRFHVGKVTQKTCVGICVRSARLLGYQHVGISNVKCSHCGLCPTRGLHVNSWVGARLNIVLAILANL